jgi:hypothetical protein
MPDPSAMRIFALPQATTREQAMENAVESTTCPRDCGHV